MWETRPGGAGEQRRGLSSAPFLLGARLSQPQGIKANLKNHHRIEAIAPRSLTRPRGLSEFREAFGLRWQAKRDTAFGTGLDNQAHHAIRKRHRRYPPSAVLLRRTGAPVFAALRPGRLPAHSKTWRQCARFVESISRRPHRRRDRQRHRTQTTGFNSRRPGKIVTNYALLLF
jgi:hypothetical protein